MTSDPVLYRCNKALEREHAYDEVVRPWQWILVKPKSQHICRESVFLTPDVLW